jgi:hypothetical protein
MIKNGKDTSKCMGKITISLSKYSDNKLRLRAKKHFRSISKEVEFLINLAEELGK